MRYIIAFLISLVAFFVLDYFDINNILMIGLMFIIILIIILAPPILYTTLLQTDEDKLERFLLKNKKNPHFYIIYALANELDEEVNDITEALLHKYKQASRQATYSVVRALYFKNLQEAKVHVNQIKPLKYKLYYQSIILIEEDDLDGAEILIEQMKTNWMRYALLAEIEQKRNHLSNARNYAHQARSKSRGLQRYILHKTYEREFGF
ncbi:hypothetical protein JCM21714_2336 [Gracilibacillus boraciitolerans JCM 21714]|uniref:Uncharacterized protein n=1 Tax=Gracilibacillus boraciitolerans JCM 21714 TaxID=1298598 RepID=W4VKH1_9BACI|nr:hypothetical protein [Gracilibacillus boraciitolerans]GAE93269.1 hypothetical protein JCM21714_2336 [Gracilibacillus boraciitolerans JCM 21714]